MMNAECRNATLGFDPIDYVESSISAFSIPHSELRNELPMIILNLDVMLAKRKMRSNELAERIGLTHANLSILKTGKAKAIRLSTLDAICRELQCTPGDILEYREDEP